MRIISGTAKGRTIVAPKGRDTRPTQDYVRESLFNIIQRDVPCAYVLDLFGGSGALGLEALSRGAARAVFSDKSRQAVECIRRNVETLGFTNCAVAMQGDWQSVLNKLESQQFDLVFLDPPYSLTKYHEITKSLKEQGLLANDALIVIEHRKDVEIQLSPLFTLKDVRTYGDTVIHFYRCDMEGDNHDK